jgi:pyruvoyl-dependent arginine decarboxylase (PvlArgDC)
MLTASHSVISLQALPGANEGVLFDTTNSSGKTDSNGRTNSSGGLSVAHKDGNDHGYASFEIL